MPNDPSDTKLQAGGSLQRKPPEGPTCGVNMTFNYSVGVVASAIGLALVYFAWVYFRG